ncbi:unnamed protein product [Caenorhabditis bovis]|uniref:Piwi domain-containing protein n=1 Tax=Caenorhabditis bovis TaxID=2654633 RepID=A0A8S1F6R2_9PELO|nr:unnamed protein product [Caenorhabditis bovis]
MSNDLLGSILSDMSTQNNQKNSATSSANKPPIISNPSSGVNSFRETFRIPKRQKDSVEGPEKKKIFASASSTKDSFLTKPDEIVRVNMFPLDISDLCPIIEQYHLDILIENKKGKQVSVNDEKKGYGDISRVKRLWGLMNIWKHLPEKRPDLFSNMKYHEFIFDGGATFYGSEGKYLGGNEESVELMVPTDIEPSRLHAIQQISRGEIIKIIIKIQRVKPDIAAKIIARGPQAYERLNSDQLIRFLECTLSQNLYTRDFFTFGSSTFLRTSDYINDRSNKDKSCQMDDEGIEIKTGFTKSIRLLNGSDGTPTFVVVIDVHRSAFYQESSVLKLMAKLIKNRGSLGRHGNFDTSNEDGVYRILEQIKSIKSSDLRKILDPLKTVAVSPKHLNSGKLNLFYIMDFDFRDHDKITFPFTKDGDTKMVTVEEYFLRTKNIKLRYNFLPFAIERKKESVSFHPLELLEIERGQRVKQNHIPASITKELTGKLLLLPENHLERYTSILQNFLKVEKQKSVKSYGIRVKLAPFRVPSKILPPPTLRADNETSTPRNDTNHRVNVILKNKFARPAHINKIVLVHFEGVEKLDMTRFRDKLLSCSEHYKIKINDKNFDIVACQEKDFDGLRNLMENAKQEKVSIVLGVTKEQKPDVHDYMKLLEAETGQQTYHLWLSTIRKCLMDSGNSATIDNVIRKLNVKAGGLNFIVTVPTKRNNQVVCNGDSKAINDKFFKNVMFVGFEFSHAGSTCLFDRQNNVVCGTPSVVGFTYSFEKSTDLGGFPWLQVPRSHQLHYLSKHFPVGVMNYYKQCKTLPSCIVIYRSGTSVGADENAEGELCQLSQGIKMDPELQKRNGGKPYTPKIVHIVVSKRCKLRLFPDKITGKKPQEQNVRSGTSVDGAISTKGLQEFVLVSQTGSLGTTRPTKYTIVRNDAKWTLNEIEHLTYFLSFGHQVSYAPPGVPAILFAAENMAKRGLNNFKTSQMLQKITELDRENATEDTSGKMMEALTSKFEAIDLQCKQFWA